MNISTVEFQKIIYYSVVAFAFTLPLSRALISFFIIFLPLLWLLEGNFKQKFHKIQSSKVLLTILFFISFNIISLFWTQNISVGLDIFRLNLYFLTLFVIATTLKKDQVQVIISSFLLGMFMSEIIAYGVFFEFWTFKHATVENPSPFMMHIDYSVFMAFTSLLLLNRILSNHYILKQKLIYTLFFITITGNLFLAIGRTGQVAFIVGIIVISIIHFRISLKSIFISIFLLFLIFYTAYNLSDTFKKRAYSGINDIEKISNMNLNSSWGIRVAYYIITYDTIKEDLILGVGIGDYIDQTTLTIDTQNYPFLNEKTKKFMKKFHPHSQYLLILLQMGIIGLLLLIYLIYHLFTLNIDNPEIKELSIIFTVVYFIGCIPEPLLHKQFTLGLFVLFIGIFSIENHSLKNKKFKDNEQLRP